MTALFDVNAVIALLDPNHVFHETVHEWWGAHLSTGWASCPLTENGVLRVMSQPVYSAQIRLTPAIVSDALRQFRANTRHEFWPDSVSILDGKVELGLVVGHRQLTDVYLLALATEHRARLVTFDSQVPLAAVPGARPENLVVL